MFKKINLKNQTFKSQIKNKSFPLLKEKPEPDESMQRDTRASEAGFWTKNILPAVDRTLNELSLFNFGSADELMASLSRATTAANIFL